jgi:hypothetical protein
MIAAQLAEQAHHGIPIVRMAVLLVVFAALAFAGYVAFRAHRRAQPERKDTGS